MRTQNSFLAQLDRTRTRMLVAASADARQDFISAMHQLVREGAAKNARRYPDVVSDFSLRNSNREMRQLGEFLDMGPVVLSFFLGGWCPFCNLELAALQKALPRVRNSGAAVIAVSPQSPDQSDSLKRRLHLDFEILSDPDNRVALEYGLRFRVPETLQSLFLAWGVDLALWNGGSSWTLPVPATYILDSAGRITHDFVDTDYTKRMDPEYIVACLRSRYQ
jgi:peroxiredoxin